MNPAQFIAQAANPLAANCPSAPITLDDALRISQGLLTPAIALLAAYIAWQQWKTNQQKLNIDQYDHRLNVYEEFRKILGIVLRDGYASFDDLLRFRTSVSQADFLFGPEVTHYIDEVYKHGLELARWTELFKMHPQERPEDYDHQKVVREKHKELEWLVGQIEPAKNLFKKYLSFGART